MPRKVLDDLSRRFDIFIPSSDRKPIPGYSFLPSPEFPRFVSLLSNDPAKRIQRW
jgi:hypothetical protein